VLKGKGNGGKGGVTGDAERATSLRGSHNLKRYGKGGRGRKEWQPPRKTRKLRAGKT